MWEHFEEIQSDMDQHYMKEYENLLHLQTLDKLHASTINIHTRCIGIGKC